MNLPNKLTILRTLMIPVFLFFLLTDCAGDYSKWIAVVVFILASLTEFIISGFRLIASDNGIVIAASYWGKFKTNFQMFMIIMLIIDLGTSTAVMIENILIVIATALTIISLVDYLVKNKQVLSEGN